MISDSLRLSKNQLQKLAVLVLRAIFQLQKRKDFKHSAILLGVCLKRRKCEKTGLAQLVTQDFGLYAMFRYKAAPMRAFLAF